jgi:hypothetical protein
VQDPRFRLSYDPCAHGLADLPRIADGEHEVPDLEAVGIAEREFHQAIRAHLDDCHVGLGIGADTPRRQRPAVGDLTLMSSAWLMT